jgi:hypothetical protein
MPKIPLTELHRSLHRLNGSWRGEEKIAPSPWDPAGATAHAQIRNRVALGGLVVIQEYDQTRAGAVVFQGHGVFSVNGPEVVLDWWDNWSATPRQFRGAVEGDVLTLLSRDPKGQARASWRIGPTEYLYALEVSSDGDVWTRYIEATYQKI